MSAPLDLVAQHLAAFNARNLDGVLATFHDDAVFATGDHLIVGVRGLRALFADAFSELEASLELREALTEGDTVACEMVERVRAPTLGVEQEFAIAAFYTVREGRFTRVKVYREGVA